VAGDQQEPNRVLGFPLRTRPAGTRPAGTRPAKAGPFATDSSGGQSEEEPQRVLGVPVDLFDTLRQRFRAMLRRLGR
jgi:hypothetical protein